MDYILRFGSGWNYVTHCFVFLNLPPHALQVVLELKLIPP